MACGVCGVLTVLDEAPRLVIGEAESTVQTRLRPRGFKFNPSSQIGWVHDIIDFIMISYLV